MIATIHTLKARAKFDDDTYRDLLEKETGFRSAKDLSVTDAGRVIDRLRNAVGDPGPNGAVAGLQGPIGKKLRALWIAGYNLGVVRDRSDRAMLSFVERQTGVSHINFLSEPRAGNSAIEGLKAWLARMANVEWPTDTSDVSANKEAVLRAQWRILATLGVVTWAGGKHPYESMMGYVMRLVRVEGLGMIEGHHLDDAQNAFGRKIRAAHSKLAAGKGDK